METGRKDILLNSLITHCHFFLPDSLTDSDILELSRRITDAEELWSLGVKVLGLPEHEIRSAQTKYHPDINQTAHHLLTTWLRQQVDRQEAYTALLAALRRCEGMQNLAGRLKQWVEGSGGTVGPVLGESKFFVIVNI